MQQKNAKGLTHHTLVGFFWSFSGTGGQAVLQLLVLSVLSRLLTVEDYGLANIANVITVLASVFFKVGVGPSIIQRADLTTNHVRSAFTLSVILGGLLSTVIYTMAPVFAGLMGDLPGLTETLRGLSFLFVISGFSTVATALNYRNLNFKIKARFQLTSYFLGFGIVGIGLAFLGYGVWALVWASLVQALISAFCYLRASPHPKRPQLNLPALKDLLSYGTGISLGQIFNRFANAGDNLIVGATLGARAVGVYGQAFRLMVLPAVYFGQVLDSVLFTAMSKVQDQTATLRAVYRRGVVAIALFVLPLSGFLFVLAPEFILVLLGPQWDAVVLPFQIFTVSMLFRTSYKMGDALARSNGAVYRRAYRQFIFSILVLLGAWVGHFWGVVGVTVGVSLAIIANFFSMAQLSLQITELTWSEFLKIHIAPLILAAVVLLETLLMAALLRYLGTPALITLLLAGLAALLTFVGTVSLAPRRFLGEDGMWILETLGRYLPNSFRQRLLSFQAR